MRKTAPVNTSSTELTIDHLERLIRGWILDGEIRQFTARTLEERREVTGKFLWFLRREEFQAVDTGEIRAFLAYVARGHLEPGGRWGNPRCTQPVAPATALAYFRVLRALFRFLADEESIDSFLMEKLRPPKVSRDQVQPFSPEQVKALLAAARAGVHPRRDEAVVWFLLDTGCRVSEACALRLADVDMPERRCRVRGKGRKERTLPFGRNTSRALWAYMTEEGQDPEPARALFLSDRGTRPGEGLTRNGLLQLIRRIGKTAGVQGARCSPHTFRHTFAVEFLRAGGNVFSLKELLGHTSLVMVNRYVALAQADIESQHRQFSPGDRIKRR